MKKINYEIIDRTSRPGYIKVRFKDTNEIIWARIKTPPEPDTERYYISHEQAKLLGLYDDGKSAKAWNEMTEEERNLFLNNSQED